MTWARSMEFSLGSMLLSWALVREGERMRVLKGRSPCEILPALAGILSGSSGGVR